MNEPIRVLHVIGLMDRAGAETMIMNLYRNIDRSRVQFDFVENSYAPAAYDEEIKKLGGRIYRCMHYNGKNHFAYVKWWKNFFNEHKNDYVAVHGHIGSTAAIYLKIAKKYGLYTIAHSHSSGTDHSLMAFLYAIYSYNTRNIADYFFGCSLIAGIDRYGKNVVESNKFTVLNNAINTADFQFDATVRQKVRRELGINDDAFVVGHVGRFLSVKNHRFLVEVFSKILDKKPDSKLLLVGDGELRHEIEDKVERLGIKGQVIFTGVRSDVNRMLLAMDVFVFPSLFEGLPVTLIEAQTSGLPCVMSDKVPEESIKTQGLVFIKKLEDNAEMWAEEVIECSSIERKSRIDEIKSAGYDITHTAAWLADFYCSIKEISNAK